CRLVRQTPPGAKLALVGQYARRMSSHAAEGCAADFVVTQPPELRDLPSAFDLYGDEPPPFLALQLNPDIAVAEARAAVERGVIHFTFFEDDICRDGGEPLREIVAKTKRLHKHLRLHFICGLDPAKV